MKVVKENKIKFLIRNLKPNYVVLFIIDSKKYHRIHPKIIRYIIEEKKFSGIYITVNKPYENLIKYLEDNGIDTKNIFFIDAISKVASQEMKITENCLFIPSPSHLTDLGIALTEALETMEKKESKFLILDSISTMLVYNDFESVAKFVHFIITRLRIFGLVGLLISIEKLIDERMLNVLKEMCDEVVEIV
ncbi:MAG: hypothetical protein QXX30_02120 [Candidatus Aenigmatarchaeota archaeon]